MESFFGPIQLVEFNNTQLLFAILVFIWSGFLRSGIGFGGAALGLPMMLFIYDQPLFWLPVIGTHLLIFTSLTLRTRIRAVDWGYLKKTSIYIFPAKLAGVFGLLNLPNDLLILLIYSITLFYSVIWLLNIGIKSKKGWTDKLLLLTGGYVSGTSLTGAPLIVAVYIQHIDKDKLRNTLFVLWFILVTIKMTTFVSFGFDLHTASAILLLPAAGIGHVIGLKTHDYLMQNNQFFNRILGGVLMLICLLGLSKMA